MIKIIKCPRCMKEHDVELSPAIFLPAVPISNIIKDYIGHDAWLFEQCFLCPETNKVVYTLDIRFSVVETDSDFRVSFNKIDIQV